LFIYIKISNNLQFLALATVYGHLATVYYLLQKRVPTVNQIVQNGCLQFFSFLGHYFTPGSQERGKRKSDQPACGTNEDCMIRSFFPVVMGPFRLSLYILLFGPLL